MHIGAYCFIGPHSLIEANTRLALALGADQATVDADKAAFETAAAHLTTVAKEKALTVSAMYADADGIYLVKTADEPETQLYAGTGVDYLSLNPGGDYYWDIYSWENAGKAMSGDVIMLSPEGFQVADLKKQPTFAKDPALVAGQVYPNPYTAMDYSAQAKAMDVLTGYLTTAKKLG